MDLEDEAEAEAEAKVEVEKEDPRNDNLKQNFPLFATKGVSSCSVLVAI